MLLGTPMFVAHAVRPPAVPIPGGWVTGNSVYFMFSHKTAFCSLVALKTREPRGGREQRLPSAGTGPGSFQHRRVGWTWLRRLHPDSLSQPREARGPVGRGRLFRSPPRVWLSNRQRLLCVGALRALRCATPNNGVGVESGCVPPPGDPPLGSVVLFPSLQSSGRPTSHIRDC